MTDTVPKLLIVDDDRQLATMLSELLELEGFQVATVCDGEAALQQIDIARPDLVLLDVMLPGINGFEVLKRLREKHDLPVIMLTARGEESERILGLISGADDYLPKPFNPVELTARIRNVLKRSIGSVESQDDSFLQLDDLHMNLKRREVTSNGKAVPLTAAEMHVLEQLMRRPGEVLSRARLTELALGRPIEAYDRSIDTLISKLRKKLADTGFNSECIRNLRGHGYVLDAERSDS